MVEKNDVPEEEIVATTDEILPDFDDADSDEGEATLTEKLRILREKLRACEAEKRKHHEELQRTRADFLNSRRRLEEQLARDTERATDKLLGELITLMDSFDTAMGDRALWESIDEKWRTGIEAIHGKLLSILKNNGVTPVDPTGTPFNPEEHEAVGNMPVTEDAQVDRVLTVLQRGFKRNSTIIRPARVIVGTK